MYDTHLDIFILWAGEEESVAESEGIHAPLVTGQHLQAQEILQIEDLWERSMKHHLNILSLLPSLKSQNTTKFMYFFLYNCPS